MKFERFEDMIVWKKARILVKDVYLAFSNSRDYGFNDQIQRSAISVMNNISEGFEKKTNTDFVKYLYIAKGSCGEIRSMLYAALDLQKIDKSTFEDLYMLCFEISKMLSGLIKTLEKNK